MFDVGKDAIRNQVENLHLSHVEHMAMTMMLNDQTLVEKQHCRQFSDMTIQSFYRFNTSSTIKQTAWTNSDNCLQYEVSMLPETNVFLGIVLTNTTCPSREEVTFCPCSVTGRQCILCQDQVYILKEFLVFFCFCLWDFVLVKTTRNKLEILWYT